MYKLNDLKNFRGWRQDKRFPKGKELLVKSIVNGDDYYTVRRTNDNGVKEDWMKSNCEWIPMKEIGIAVSFLADIGNSWRTYKN